METPEEIRAYLAKVRKTIDEANRLREAVALRVAETDRMLAKQGLTREQVAAMRFTPEQVELVNAELKKRGYKPLEELDVMGEDGARDEGARSKEQGASSEERSSSRNFGMLMQGMRL